MKSKVYLYVSIPLVVVLPGILYGVSKLIRKLSRSYRFGWKLDFSFSWPMELLWSKSFCKTFNLSSGPLSNATYSDALNYCTSKGLKLPDDPEQLAFNFDWWELADNEARNSKDGRVLFWSSVKQVFKNDELLIIKGKGQNLFFYKKTISSPSKESGAELNIERFLTPADKLAMDWSGRMFAVTSRDWVINTVVNQNFLQGSHYWTWKNEDYRFQ